MLEKQNDMLKFLESGNYPNGVRFCIDKNITQLYRISCISCYEIGLGWSYIINELTLAAAYNLQDVFRFLKERLVHHAQGHGSDVARALIQKYHLKDGDSSIKHEYMDVHRQIEDYYKDSNYRTEDGYYKDLFNLKPESSFFDPKLFAHDTNWVKVEIIGRHIEREDAE